MFASHATERARVTPQGNAVEEKVAPSSQMTAKSKAPAKPKRPRLDWPPFSNALSEPTFGRAPVAAGAGYRLW